MSRRTITIDARLDQVINVVRGFFLLLGQDYNYTEVVNGAIFYGACYWLGLSKEKAMELAGHILTTELKLEGLKDEERTKLNEAISSKLELPKGL
jgi:hypothetical protein